MDVDMANNLSSIQTWSIIHLIIHLNTDGDNNDYLQSVKGVQFISIGHYATEYRRQRIISYY